MGLTIDGGILIGGGIQLGEPPGYSITPASLNVDEGSSLTINVSAKNVSNGTTLYWTINNVTTVDADFSAVSGSFNVTSEAGSFTVTPVLDATTEGSETFTVSLREGSTSGPVVATTNSITVNDTSLDAANEVQYWIVGGGGAGGYAADPGSSQPVNPGQFGAGGGGGGGVLTASNYPVQGYILYNTTYTITVGAGGSASSSASYSGNDSLFNGIRAYGGGCGGTPGDAPSGNRAGKDGGSGGGGMISGAAGKGVYPGSTFHSQARQGYDGGTSVGVPGNEGAGGGGGAGGAGGNSSGLGAGNGGAAASGGYGGGGGGGGSYVNGSAGAAGSNAGAGAPGAASGGTASNGKAGTANFGGGGGGGGGGSTKDKGGSGGAGGSGVVVIKYPVSKAPAYATTGTVTYTVSGGYRTYTFKSSGTIRF